MKRIYRAVLALVFFGITALAQVPAKPLGRVSDFANKLNQPDREKLEKTLADFEQKTSIEIAFVTVTSLNGEPVETYTKDLANRWGVGKRGANNGIMLLWAPNERLVRMAVGDGLRPFLSDLDAQNILARDLWPLFAQEQYARGIFTAVNQVMARLGEKPWSARMADLAAAQAEADRQQRLTDEAFRKALPWFIAVLVGIAAIIVIVMIVSSRNSTRKSRADLLADIATCRHNLTTALTRKRSAEQNLEVLQALAPAEVCKEFAESCEKLESKTRTLSRKLDDLEREVPTGSWDRLWELRESLPVQKCEYLAKLPTVINNKIAEFREAETKARQLLEKAPAELERIRTLATSKRQEHYFTTAEKSYQETSGLLAIDLVNWIIVYELLSGLFTNLAHAENPPSLHDSSSSYTNTNQSIDTGPFGGGSMGDGGASTSY